MADIKTKARGTVKALDKARLGTERLKENVIIGKLIPAGTGVKKYRNTEFTLEKEFFDEEPLDVLEEELL